MKNKQLRDGLIREIIAEEAFLENFLNISTDKRTRRAVLKESRHKLALMYDFCEVLKINPTEEIKKILNLKNPPATQGNVIFAVRNSESITESVNALLNQISKSSSE